VDDNVAKTCDETECNSTQDSLMGVLDDEFAFGADEIADPSQNADPDTRADQCVKSKPEMVHAGKSSRDRDEMPNNGQQPTDER
jgi:hypothetical protein